MPNLMKYKHRYIFEHRVLPQYVYSGRAGVLNAIIEKGGDFFIDLYTLIPYEGKLRYRATDFSVEPRGFMHEDKKVYVAIINMPKPEISPLCRRAYVFFEEKTDTIRYYTSELSVETPFMLCGWDENQAHINLGKSELDLEKEFLMAARHFIGIISGEIK